MQGLPALAVALACALAVPAAAAPRGKASTAAAPPAGLPAGAHTQPLQPQLLVLPAEVRAALQRAQVPEQALAVVLHDASTGRRLLQVQADRPMNPASLMKLPTTLAALDRLGPAWTWSTPLWLAGPVRDGVLEGHLHIRGSGDPKLVLERAWLLLRRVQQLGVREIRGDIVIDQSAIAAGDGNPGDFDGEALRPYNVRPAALLLNYRTVVYTFVPDAAAGTARVLSEPSLAGVQVDRSVPLLSGACGDWRAALKPSLEPGRVRFAGGLPAACGEVNWPLADPDPGSFDARMLQALWREMGGTLGGSVREGPAPLGTPPSAELPSPPLLDVVRDINKFSNNVMAQQLFLTLAAQANPGQPATPEAAREVMRRWLATRASEWATDAVVDNGSGLSRENRLSARLLAALLLQAWDSPVMAELMSSLPISGVDGTLRRSRAAAGRAHLKTGSLRDVTGVAGYVLTHSGRRLVLVAMVNHPQAQAARPALDALVQWALRDTPLQAGMLPGADTASSAVPR